jgi:hypothetical protein
LARDVDSGAPCDAAGGVFPDESAATCILFDSIDEARGFCEGAVEAAPTAQFDVFDAAGRVNPPLFTIVHPARARTLDTHPAAMRKRRVIAWTLIVAGVPLIIFAYVERRQMEIVFPAFIGINMIIIGGRLLWMNLAIRETERARATRLADATNGIQSHPPHP